jgi:hypothetical protein
MENYYYAYRYMAVMDKNKVFATMTDELENTIPEKLGFWLAYMLEDKDWLTPLPGTSMLPVDYVKDFKGSNIVRIRRGTVDASILMDNSAFFTFFNNKAALEAIRFASAFFGKGQFVSQQLTREGKGWKLSQQLIGPYYQPFDSNELPGDGDWAKMPRMKRPLSEVQQLESTIMIHEHSGTFELEFNIEGTANVPVALELAFRKGGKLTGTTDAKDILDAYLSQNAVPIIYEFEGDKIEIDSGLHEHAWTQLRGALPKLDAISVYLTGFTPFNKSILISAG